MTNSTLGTPTSDLSLVSSQYGPGPVIGWLLAASSVLFAFVLQKEAHDKRKRTWLNHLSADFVATIIFPVVAIGDIALQIGRYPGTIAEIGVTTAASLHRHIQALEAPLVVVEDALIITFPLLVAALYRQYWGKALILVLVNVGCLAVESVILAKTAIRRAERPYANFSRTFIANSEVLLAIAWWLILPGTIFIVVSYALSLSTPESQSPGRQHSAEQESGATGPSTTSNPDPSSSLKPRRVLKLLIAIWLSAIVNICIANTAGNAMSFATRIRRSGSGSPSKAWKLVFTELLPRTNTSIMDLDQMIPAVGGALLLALNAFQLLAARRYA